MAIKSRGICENCGAEIGPYETPYLHDWKVVCAVCDVKLKSQPTAGAGLKSILGIGGPQLAMLVAGIAMMALAGFGAYQWGYRDGRADGVSATRAAAAQEPIGRPASTRPANELGLPDDPEAVLALMRYGALRKGMSVSAWKSSAGVNRIRTARRNGGAGELESYTLEEVVAGGALPIVRYEAVVADDKIVSWKSLDR